MPDVVRPELIDVPRRIETARLVLRPVERADADELFAAVDASRETVGRWLPWVERTVTVEDSQVAIAGMQARWATHEDLALGIFDRSSGAILGGTGLHRIDWRIRSFDIGYWLATAAEGHGYVSEAVAALTRMAFEALDANRVSVRADPENTRSCAVPTRLGFTFEGTLRQSLVGEDGTPVDQAVYAVVRGDELPREREPTATSWH